MENLFQSILSIQKLLLEAGIPSIVIGGMAVAAWDEPRLTRDVDLKVLLNRQGADRLLEVLSTHYQPLGSTPRDTLRKQALIFIQDSLGTRLDLLDDEYIIDWLRQFEVALDDSTLINEYLN
jgi:hypothetical protein